MTVTGENFDAMGNTITYDQYVTISSTEGMMAETTVARLVLLPLSDEETNDEFLQVLQEKDPAFEAVTSVESSPVVTQSVPKSKEDSPSRVFIIIILVVVILVICCCAGCIMYEIYGGGKARGREYNEENDEMQCALPEGPRLDEPAKDTTDVFYDERQ